MEKEAVWMRKKFLTGTRICPNSDQFFRETYHKPYLKSMSQTDRQDESGRHLRRLPSPNPSPEQHQ